MDKICPRCQNPVRVEEYPGNFVFLVDGQVVTHCPNCRLEFEYVAVVNAGDVDHPLDPFGVTE